MFVIAAAPIIALLASDSPIPFLTRALGALTWFLCLLPAYAYLGRPPVVRRPLPFVQTVSIIYGLYFAFPIALGQVNKAWRVTVDPRDGYDLAMQLIFLGWIAMIGTYGFAGQVLRRRAPADAMMWKPDTIAVWGAALLLGGVAVNTFRTFLGTGVGVGGVLQLFVALQWLGLGLLTVLARRGELSSGGKAILFGGFAAAVSIVLAQGNISPIVMLCVVVGFALWVGRPVIEARWIVLAVTALLIAVSMRGVIRDFRLAAWFGHREYTQIERIQLMAGLLMTRIENEGIVGALSGGGAQTAQRSAQMDVFADVIRRTPSEIPYWSGDTYKSLIGAAVPRVLWPDKPTKELGQAFGHRYRYLDPTNKSTAINLPVVVEFYANFGALAVIVGMAIVGLIYAGLDVVVNRPGQSPLMSMMGLALLMPLLIIESDFSLVFGGLPLSGFALWGVWRAMRHTLVGGQTKARARASQVPGFDRLGPGPGRPSSTLPAR